MMAVNALTATVLKTTYPCCGKVARIAVTKWTPREAYDRNCHQCERHWRVTRITLAEAPSRLVERVDRLDWEITYDY